MGAFTACVVHGLHAITPSTTTSSSSYTIYCLLTDICLPAGILKCFALCLISGDVPDRPYRHEETDTRPILAALNTVAKAKSLVSDPQYFTMKLQLIPP